MKTLQRIVSLIFSVVFLSCVSLFCVHLWNPVEFDIFAQEYLSSVYGYSFTQTPAFTVQPAADYTANTRQECRELLQTPQEQQLYDLLCQGVYRISEQSNENGEYLLRNIILENARLTPVQIRTVYFAFQSDHPEVFWLSNSFGYAYHGGSTVVYFRSRVSAARCTQLTQALAARVETLLQDIPPGQSELDREIYVFDLLTDVVQYDPAAASDETQWEAYTVVGALLQGNAVCEGYARALQLLCANVGLRSRIISGSVQSGAHVWNLIMVDGKWYHTDATWDDSREFSLFFYFNLNDASIRTDHTVAPEIATLTEADFDENPDMLFNLPLPRCTDSTGTYYARKATPIGALNAAEDQRAIADLLTAARQGAPRVFFYVPAQYSFDQTVNSFLLENPYKLQYYVMAVNRELKLENAGRYIQYDGCRYVSHAKTGGIILLMDYGDTP